MTSTLKRAMAATGVASLVLAGCGTAVDQAASSGTTRVAAATATAAAQAGTVSPSGVSPITMSAIGAPLVVAGSDGNWHIDYDLLVTNVFSAPVTLTAVGVRNGRGASVLKISGKALAPLVQGNFSQTAVNPPAQIPESGQVSVEIDIKLPMWATVPKELDQVIAWRLPANAPAMAILNGATTGELTGLPLTVSPIQAVRIAAPLKGAGWMSLNGCCSPNAHRSLRYAVVGNHEIKSEMFAVDWVRLHDGTFFTGDGSSNADYPYFGTPVLAVANGVVVKTRDGMPNQVPGEEKGINTAQDYAGNSVVIEIAPYRFAIYAHLDLGTVAVKVGERVKVGQVVGKLGNSGNTTAAHLHFVITNGPDFVTSTSIPFVIGNWTLQGNAIIPSVPGKIKVIGPPSSQHRTHPLYLSVARFR